MSFAITGCPFSGTTWASVFWSALGHQCDHEKYFAPGRVMPRSLRKANRGESSYLCAPFTDSIDCPVVHLVRDPIKVVRSGIRTGFLTGSNGHERLVARLRPDIVEPEDQLGRVIRLAALWDQDVEGHVLHVDRHSPVDAINAVEMSTGCRPDHGMVTALLAILGEDINARSRHVPVSLGWAMIREHPDGHLLIAKAERFGYEVD